MTACDAFSSPDAAYGGVCVDQKTQQRLPDDQCGDCYSSGGHYMMWFPRDYDGSTYTCRRIG